MNSNEEFYNRIFLYNYELRCLFITGEYKQGDNNEHLEFYLVFV